MKVSSIIRYCLAFVIALATLLAGHQCVATLIGASTTEEGAGSEAGVVVNVQARGPGDSFASAVQQRRGRRSPKRKAQAVASVTGPVFACPPFNTTKTNYATATAFIPRCEFEAEPGSYITLSISAGCQGAPILRLYGIGASGKETAVAEGFSTNENCRAGTVTYMVPSSPTQLSPQMFALLVGCWADGACQGTITGRVYATDERSFQCPAYRASGTNYASPGPNSPTCPHLLSAGPGDYISVSVTGEAEGSPVLKLQDAAGAVVADGYWAPGVPVMIKYFVPLSSSRQNYVISQGCWKEESCAAPGVAARVYNPYTVFDTYQDQGTYSFWATAGETVLIDSVEEWQRAAPGQTLSLLMSPFNVGLQQVVASAQGTPTCSAFIEYTVPDDGSIGTKVNFTIKAGCVAEGKCRGRVALTFRRRSAALRTKATVPTRWEGWGASLAWWANVVGGSQYQDMFVDLFFTNKTVNVMGRQLPGLGLTVARYNVGGSARPSDKVFGSIVPAPWSDNFRTDIEGFWLDWGSRDPSSSSWDMTRDSYQRRVLQAVIQRCAAAAGTRSALLIEFFSNAPMWWMTKELTSAGGTLNTWNRKDFMEYVAIVAHHARTVWGVNVTYVEPFNEPSAGWWTYPVITQEGLNLSPEAQSEMIPYLRAELDKRGLKDMKISASDENTVDEAITTYSLFKTKGIDGLVDKVNLHAYYGLEAYRNNLKRRQLRDLLGNSRRVHITEFGDPDVSGMELAQTIMEDLTYIQVSAWAYWQPMEPYSGWGLINSNVDAARGADNGKVYAIHNKYYVFAHFTRFLPPRCLIYPLTGGGGGGSSTTIFAYDEDQDQVVVITLNFAAPQRIRYDLNEVVFGSDTTSRVPNGPVKLMIATRTTDKAGGKLFQPVVDDKAVTGRVLRIDAEPWSIYSTVISLCPVATTIMPPGSALGCWPTKLFIRGVEKPTTTPSGVEIAFTLSNPHTTWSASHVKVAVLLPPGLTFVGLNAGSAVAMAVGSAEPALQSTITSPANGGGMTASLEGIVLGPERQVTFTVTATVEAAAAPGASYTITGVATYAPEGYKSFGPVFSATVVKK